MKNTQTTIRDLALKLNISISTVSRALRDAHDVNPETKQAVLALARQLNYEPNRIAQSLRSKRTNTLGVIVPEINLHFFSSAISGAQAYAAKHGYTIMICQSMESFETEQSNIHMLVANRVDGLLLSLSRQTHQAAHLEALIQKKIPIVLFDRVIDGLPVSRVVVDDRGGAYQAVDYLVRTGCQHIVYLGGPTHLYISQQRLQGYRDALTAHGRTVRDEDIFQLEDFQRDDVAAAVHTIMGKARRPDAIFCMNDPIAVTVLTTLKEKGIRIPDDVSVVGFTNEPVSQYIEPALTTVTQPAYEMGQVAATLFLDQLQLKNSEVFEPVTRILPATLVVRHSTRPLPA